MSGAFRYALFLSTAALFNRLAVSRAVRPRFLDSISMEKKSIFKFGEYLSRLHIVSVEQTKVVDRGFEPAQPQISLIRDTSTKDSGEISMCNSCKQGFSTAEEQKQHYQTKWHLYVHPQAILKFTSLFPTFCILVRISTCFCFVVFFFFFSLLPFFLSALEM
jgi:hypothetical protein